MWQWGGHVVLYDVLWGSNVLKVYCVVCRENDAMWVLIAWLSILAEQDLSIDAMMKKHWRTFGRSYYGRSPHFCHSAFAIFSVLNIIQRMTFAAVVRHVMLCTCVLALKCHGI